MHIAGIAGEGASIVVAPFPGGSDLARALGALAPSTKVRELRELDELDVLAASACVVVDTDRIPTEDIGWLRRILERRRASLVCTGGDAGSRAARALLALPSARWLAWPPNLDEIRALASPMRKSQSRSPAPEPAHAGPGHAPAPERAPAAASPAMTAPTPSAPATSPSPSAPGAVPSPIGGAVSAVAAPGAVAVAAPERGAFPATLAREQIALLADISQRLELSFSALRESGRLTDGEIETPGIELRRLLRFTRTLSCLFAPPPRGDEEFDVAALIEEQLAALTLRTRKGPRFQPRAPGEGRGVEFFVRADRAALALAFESLLQLARLCASQGETVRVAYTPQAGDLLVGIEFPAGPLAGLSSERLADFQSIRERLPELGPNDLSAASAILASQGGALEIRALANGISHIGLHARLPLARIGAQPASTAHAATPAAAGPSTAAATSAAPRAQARARGSGNDPFA